VSFLKQAITKQNFKTVLTPCSRRVRGSPDREPYRRVSSIDIIKLARESNSLCIDTVNEPWPGFYYNTKLDNADRTIMRCGKPC